MPPSGLKLTSEEPFAITEIKLLVAQWPAGQTIHTIEGRPTDGSYSELHLFEGDTKGGDWLVFLPEAPVDDIQFIRIRTLASPSWVAWGEIQVFGE